MQVDTASAAKRLALKGTQFATSDEVVAAIREGVATKLAEAVMAALGSCFERLSNEDVCTLAELYTAAPSGPNLLAEQAPDSPRLPPAVGGDEAAGSPTPSVAAAPEGKGAISSPEGLILR